MSVRRRRLGSWGFWDWIIFIVVHSEIDVVVFVVSLLRSEDPFLVLYVENVDAHSAKCDY